MSETTPKTFGAKAWGYTATGLVIVASLIGMSFGHVIGKAGGEVVAGGLNKLTAPSPYSDEQMLSVMRYANEKMRGRVFEGGHRFDNSSYDPATRSILYAYTVSRLDVSASLFVAQAKVDGKKLACPKVKDFIDHGIKVFYQYTLPDSEVVKFMLQCD